MYTVTLPNAVITKLITKEFKNEKNESVKFTTAYIDAPNFTDLLRVTIKQDELKLVEGLVSKPVDLEIQFIRDFSKDNPTGIRARLINIITGDKLVNPAKPAR